MMPIGFVPGNTDDVVTEENLVYEYAETLIYVLLCTLWELKKYDQYIDCDTLVEIMKYRQTVSNFKKITFLGVFEHISKANIYKAIDITMTNKYAITIDDNENASQLLKITPDGMNFSHEYEFTDSDYCTKNNERKVFKNDTILNKICYLLKHIKEIKCSDDYENVLREELLQRSDPICIKNDYKKRGIPKAVRNQVWI